VKQSIARYCGNCKKYGEVELRNQKTIICPHCQDAWGELEGLSSIFERCPVCHCRHFYTSKDFNQFLGCAIMVVGIILMPLTYNLSLPVFALIDWILHKRVPTIINCYQCTSEFRGMTNDKGLKPFMHHIGVKYDKKF